MYKHTVILGFTCLLLSLNAMGRVFSGPLDMSKTAGMPMSQPMRFEENKGQVWDENQQPCLAVKFHAVQKGMHVFLMENGLAYQFEQFHYPEGYDRSPLAHRTLNEHIKEPDVRFETHRIDMELLGANPHPAVSVEEKSPDYVNYYNRGVTDVYSYSRVTYHNVYPSIDWVIYGGEEGIKYDFVVHPGGNPAQIKLLFRYHDGLAINQEQALEINSTMGMLTEARPFSYQGTQEIASAFQLQQDTVTFRIGKYDARQTLVIDPLLRWASYYGGSSYEAFSSCETSSTGDLYLGGETQSSTNIAAGGHQNTWGGGYDGILVKMDSSCQRIWATYYGGSGSDRGTNMDVDAAGNVYLMGFTNSSSNISFNGHQATLAGSQDAYIVKFNALGQRQWGTYYGGSSSEIGEGCTIDANGNVYLTGITNSTNGIAFNGFQNSFAGSQNAFLVKFNSSGQRQWGTYYGGTGNTIAVGCSHDALGNVYFTGQTNSTTNIASNGFQNTFGGGSSDAFVVKFSPSGNRIWGSYYGGAGDETGYGCRASDDGKFFLAGVTTSTNSMAQGGHQNSLGGLNDAFLARFDSACNRQWATYYGGTGLDIAHTCTEDVRGNVLLVGETSSTSSIAFGGHQNVYGGGSQDGFVAIFDSLGQRTWGTYYGGSAQDNLSGISTHSTHTFYAAGLSRSTSGMTLNGFQNNFGGLTDALLVKFGDSCTTTIDSLNLVACDSISVNGIAYNVSGNYVQQLTNARGCDSLLQLSILIRHATTGSLTQTSCGETAINGQLYMQSGTYVQQLTNMQGCDSTLTLNLTIFPNSNSAITVATCDSAIVNGQVYHQSGNFVQQLATTQGCDSTLTIQLTILPNSDTTIAVNACDSAIVNGQVYHQSGNFVQHLSNANGCDSLLELNIVISHPNAGVLTQTACGEISINGQQYLQSGTYVQQLSTTLGCDSTLTLHLTILPNSATAIAVDACDSAIVNGQVYHQSGNFVQHLSAANGCDSMITVTVSIDTVIASITGSGGTFTALPAGASYQWIDCDAGGLPIPGATAQVFTPAISGSYAVIVTRGLCSDTSACEAIVSRETGSALGTMVVSPNPTHGLLRITLDLGEADATLRLMDVQGRTVMAREWTGKEYVLDVTNVASGLYLIVIEHSTGAYFAKVVKE